ncbi:MAG: hypothetical protein ACI4E1_00775 [Lachnospira sp.]
MEIIKYNTTLKASGEDYKKIVFWNRFLRNPAELILSWVPAAISLVLLCMQIYSYFLLCLYAACWIYPIYIFCFQFKNGVNYHLAHRHPSEDAPCIMTLMSNMIMAEIPEHELTYTYEWNEFTTVYFKYGYYMFFNGKKMAVMLNSKDCSNEIQAELPDYIKSHVDRNKCQIRF